MKRIALVPLFLIAAGAVAQEAAPDAYRRPVFALPYALEKPVIDGAVGADEWRGALAVRGLRAKRGQVSVRQATFRLCWDEEHLYVAMQSPLRPGERPMQALRRRMPERNVVFDDSYEIFLDVGTRTEDGQPCFFQFLANFAGARYDVLHLPAVGNSRIGWSSGWEPVNRLTDDNVWEWEMAIPRASLFLDGPFEDGQELTLLIARNFKRPWEQNSIEGTSSFTVLDSHSRCVLSRTAPAVHLDAVGDPASGAFGFRLGAWSKEPAALRWTLEAEGAARSGMLDLPGGAAVAGPDDPAAVPPGEGLYRITVTTADGGAVLADWASLRELDSAKVEPRLDDRGDEVGLKLVFNPVRDYLRVAGDFINYDARGTLAAFRASVVDADGRELAAADLALDDLAYVEGLLPLPGLPSGEYTARLVARDADGRVALERESTFSKKDPAEAFTWWETPHGDIERVIDPWTPVRASDTSVAVWGREVRLGAAGLPEQVVSQGRRLLAGPVRLEAEAPGGTAAPAEPVSLRRVASAEHRAVHAAGATLGGLQVRSTVTTEFDGMLRYELTLDPGPEPVEVGALRLVVPFDPSQADAFHAAGRGIRYGFDYGAIPKEGEGRLWDCRKVSGNPMAVGSFVPYVYVGGPDAGLCWYADSDEGWVQADGVPAFELRRDGPGSVDLVFHLVGRPAVIDGPRTLVFAFQATPVKPVRKGWRAESWWTGDTFRDYQGIKAKGGHLIWSNIPFPLDEAASRELVEKQHATANSYIFGEGATRRSTAVPYIEWKRIAARFAPEVAYFGDQWRTSVSDGLGVRRHARRLHRPPRLHVGRVLRHRRLLPGQLPPAGLRQPRGRPRLPAARRPCTAHLQRLRRAPPPAAHAGGVPRGERAQHLRAAHDEQLHRPLARRRRHRARRRAPRHLPGDGQGLHGLLDAGPPAPRLRPGLGAGGLVPARVPGPVGPPPQDGGDARLHRGLPPLRDPAFLQRERPQPARVDRAAALRHRRGRRGLRRPLARGRGPRLRRPGRAPRRLEAAGQGARGGGQLR